MRFFPRKIWRNLADFFYLAIKSLTHVKAIDNIKSPLQEVFRLKSGLHIYRDYTFYRFRNQWIMLPEIPAPFIKNLSVHTYIYDDVISWCMYSGMQLMLCVCRLQQRHLSHNTPLINEHCSQQRVGAKSQARRYPLIPAILDVVLLARSPALDRQLKEPRSDITGMADNHMTNDLHTLPDTAVSTTYIFCKQ